MSRETVTVPVTQCTWRSLEGWEIGWEPSRQRYWSWHSWRAHRD